MMKRFLLIRDTIWIGILLLFCSCRSADAENSLSNGGVSAVKFNVLGAEYIASGNLSGQASLSKENPSDSGNSVERQSILLTPSSVITAELSPSSNASNIPAKASLASTGFSAASGNPLTSGIKFRVIAYRQSNGNYHTHQDYTVGEKAVSMMLDNGSAYNIIVYSYGSTTLPLISSGEQNNLSSAVVNYDDTSRSFMYQKISFTPTSDTNTLNITLRYKVAQFTAIINSSMGNITNISGGLIKPHYSNGSFSLSSGVMSGRSVSTSGSTVSFPSSGFPGITQTSTPVYVNADTGGALMGSISASVIIGGTTRNVNFSNSFKITPENKSNLTINLMPCGAYVGPNTNPANFKEFMCHNLGADTNADSFTPAAAIHGAKYQWGANTGEVGRYYSQADDQSNSGAISGWNSSVKPDGSWSDTSKTSNDPCPSGYRVPTKAQWDAVLANNNVERVGSWANDGYYTSALYFTNPSNKARTLMLPAVGNRVNNGGSLSFGYSGYWSSTGQGGISSNFYAISNSQNIASNDNRSGFSVRCIKE